MIILKKRKELNSILLGLKNKNKSIGFVPTMGALHEGHLSLVERASKENDITVVSIFINPTQFNNKEDLAKYPRTNEKDLELLSSIGCDYVYLPDAEDLYPEGEISKHYDFRGIENEMEGKFRPKHFDGVATVVKKLFEATIPNKAYFGEKDFQQVRIVQEMVKQENLGIMIVPVETFRESNGLAMSSRNMRLSAEQKEEAPVIYRILSQSKKWITEHSVQETKQLVEKAFEETSLKLEYFEISDEETLKPIEELKKGIKPRGFIAAFSGEIRLIDNIPLY